MFIHLISYIHQATWQSQQIQKMHSILKKKDWYYVSDHHINSFFYFA